MQLNSSTLFNPNLAFFVLPGLKVVIALSVFLPCNLFFTLKVMCNINKRTDNILVVMVHGSYLSHHHCILSSFIVTSLGHLGCCYLSALIDRLNPRECMCPFVCFALLTSTIWAHTSERVHPKASSGGATFIRESKADETRRKYRSMKQSTGESLRWLIM